MSYDENLGPRYPLTLAPRPSPLLDSDIPKSQITTRRIGGDSYGIPDSDPKAGLNTPLDP